LAEALSADTDRPCRLLPGHRRVIVRRALVAWERSPESFGEEVVALNDVDEALRNNCTKEES
jgi:hypothetical protein